MSKISLKSIQNTGKNSEKKVARNNNDKILTKYSEISNKPKNVTIKNDVPNEDFKLLLENIKTKKTEKKFNEIPKSEVLKPVLKEKQELNEHEKTKLIGLLHFYIAEFPEKLQSYKAKNFHKMDADKLLEMKEIFKKEISISSNLTMAVEASVKMLELYEFACCNFGVNIKGVSKIGETEEYKQTVKSVLLKYFDNSLISCVEPEYKLAYLIISNSLICHQINSMSKTNNKINTIERPTIEQPKTNIDENEQRIKEMELRNINNKYSDL
jgi:hypothetical protein